MIADAARDRAIFRMLLECHLEYSCLYSGYLPPALEIAAPYLVQLEHRDKYTRRILQRGWGDSWGIFLKCDLGLDRLRRHLRQFLVVRDPRGGRLVFRYYDPRVLRVYLPTCREEELNSLFGPIQCFWSEGEDPRDMLEFRFHRGSLARRTLGLDSERPSDPRAPGSESYANPGAEEETRPRYTNLTIRQAQLAILSRIELRKFEDWMVEHLNKFFPGQCEAAGEEQIRATIQYGVKRAASYGITTERDVCKYIDLMVVFGRDFDEDRRFAWTRDILGKEENPSRKIEALHEAAKGHLRRR